MTPPAAAPSSLTGSIDSKDLFSAVMTSYTECPQHSIDLENIPLSRSGNFDQVSEGLVCDKGCSLLLSLETKTSKVLYGEGLSTLNDPLSKVGQGS